MRPLHFILAGLFVAAFGTAILLQHRAAKPKAFPFANGAAALSPIPTDLSNLLARLSKLPPDSAVPRELRIAASMIERSPTVSDHWVRLGDALVQRSRDSLDASAYQQIEQVYLYAHKLDATNASALVGLAWAAGASHRFDDSVAWAMLALKGDSELPAAYGVLGDAAVELGRYDEASRHYQKMLDLRPDLGSYSRAAHLLYLQGNVQKSFALIRKAIAAGANDPENTAWCVAEEATMLCREGAAPVALKAIEKALKKTPSNPLLLAALGQARMAMGNDAEAITALEQSIARMPQHTTLAALHDLYLSAGRTADAARIASEIEALHRKLESQGIQGGEGSLARFYADRGENLPEAVRLAEFEFGHHRNAVAADTLAWAYYRAGRAADAVKTIPEILRHRASDPAMLYHVGLIEEAVGNTTDARRHLYAALSRESRFNPVHAKVAVETLNRLGSIPTPVAVAKGQ